MPTDAEIASRAHLLPIPEVAAKLGIPADALEMYGPYKAKLSRTFLHNLQERPSGKLVLVTAISPTPAGEGKSTTVVGLADALNRIGKRAAVCLREPSLGPCFGMKGGATGGGKAQVVPMEDINLHFTGDMHAITTAHNLLTALIDNHIHHGNTLDIDPRRIIWRRVMDLNDRALREIVTGGEGNRYKRKAHFDITVASEVMAILCLATSIPDLRHRLGEILIAYGRDGRAIFARDLHAHGAMAALLKDAIKPNLVQTMEHTPAFIHGGPFANIAHGCNSIAATQAALKLADFVVTEAGFGADLGAEKFIDIKCRKAGLWPDVAVLVATVRALKFHGGVEKGDLDQENLPALRNGIANLRRHLENLQGLFGLPVVVAINPFPTDTAAELSALQEEVARLGATAIISRHWAEGSAGATELAAAVAAAAESSTSQPQFLYDNDLPLWKKIETIAKRVYRAEKVVASETVKRQLRKFDAEYRHFPICMAKTQYSFSSSPTLRGAPEGHEIKVTEVRLSRGAGFVVVVCGNIMTMPGLPKVPASMHISLSDEGIIAGLS